MTFACKECRFFESRLEECRRRAPVPSRRWLDFHNSELLRDIAWTLRQAHNVEEPNSHDDICQEATECGQERWPHVDEKDWCGEFETK